MGINKVHVEVAYATPQEQRIVGLDIVEGASMYDAVIQSGIQKIFPEIDPDTQSMGIFGKAVKNPKAHALREGDRVEIYRPLKIDPKQARLNRAAKKAE
ncbi:MAG: RnfH family protein [Hahellaceae bacterium]|nr:RnfH family protein [Hahellaceae bacterium]MCP5168743.1 RnfH family protein [Hahellaceae bacterium]